jgi:hypothetical protein
MLATVYGRAQTIFYEVARRLCCLPTCGGSPFAARSAL